MDNYGYVVIKIRGFVGSKLYKFKTMDEREFVPNSLSLLVKPGTEVVTLTNLDGYDEYKPYIETHNLKDLYRYVLEL